VYACLSCSSKGGKGHVTAWKNTDHTSSRKEEHDDDDDDDGCFEWRHQTPNKTHKQLTGMFLRITSSTLVRHGSGDERVHVVWALLSKAQGRRRRGLPRDGEGSFK